jgi:hypothetical protein
MWY